MKTELVMPKVTVLLPTYQSESYLKGTLESVFSQTYGDYELLVVDDASTDQTLDILERVDDPRLRVLQGRCKGLADALNLGIARSRGAYIARIDADDLMTPDRLKKQVLYMEAHPEVAVCGGWQQYFGLSTFLHAPPPSADQCRANLLFRCDLCHSTVMMRKSTLLDNGLYYEGCFAAEDYELWTRVLDFGQIVNLPEVLGYYRENGNGITEIKKQRLIRENGCIVAAALERNLQIVLSEQQKHYFAGWVNPFFQRNGGIPRCERSAARKDLQDILQEIIIRNRRVGYYEEQALLRTIQAEWATLRYNLPFALCKGKICEQDIFRKRWITEVLLRKGSSFCRNYRGFRRKYLKISAMLHRS